MSFVNPALLFGALLFAVHVTMQDYVVQLGPWYF